MTYSAPEPMRAAPQGQRQWKLLVVGLVIGVLVGAGALGLTWLLSSPPSDGPDADAATACEVLARTPDADLEKDRVGMHRLGIAYAAALAAAEGDDQYESLADALLKPRSIASRDFNTSSPEFRTAMAAARAACDGI